MNVTGNLVLAGNINVTQNPTISAGSYRLFNYGGVLTNNGTIINVAPAAPGLTEQLVFGVPGQVNLLVLNSAAIGITQFWDGAHANNTTIEGGTASWDNFNNNWTTAAGTTNSSWQNGVANFGAVAGTVTLVDNINAQGLVFGTTGYVIQGSGAFTLNLVGGAAPAPFVTVTAGLTATINAPITGSAGLTSNGGGTLVLTNAANAYTGGTTITGGGAISVAADGALGATGVGNGLTLNGGSLIATAGFTSARTVALTGIGTVDVTGANVLALTGIISGAAGNTLTKVDTGTLNLTGVNTYAGGTAIVAGTVQITNDGNLGNIVGGVTFGGVLGGNATLQTLGAVTSARAITLNLGGGTVDTNGFNSTLSGIIGGAAGNPLTKIGAGTLTVTGASTYLGQTNVNAGTLQVGDGATAGTQIGNNAATVVVNTGGTLAINLPAGGTFGNAVTNNFGGVINAITAANSQTVSGVISGAGVFNQNGAGTTILTNNANSYTGATNVLLGHLQIGNGTTGNLASGTAVSVSAGAFLDLNLGNNVTFAPTNIADSGAVQGINTTGNTQTVSGVISGGGTFAQTGAGTTIFTGVNTFAGGTTANNAGLVQVGTAALTGALGSGAVTLGNAGGTLNLVNVSGNTFANNVAGTGGTDTVNVNSVNTNTLSGAYTGTLSLNQIGAGTTILTNAGNIYTAGTRVSAGTLQVGTAALPGSVGQNLAANTISVSGGGTLTFVNLAAATNPLLNNITNGVGAVGLVNANSASTITLGGTLTNGALGTLALTQSGTGTTILTNAGNTYTGATTVSAGTLQIGTGVNAGSIGSAAVAVTTGGILSLINVGGPVANTFSNAVSNGVLGNGTVNVGGITNPLIISGVLSDGAAGTLSLTQSGTGKTILTATDTYTGATNVSAGTLQVGNGATGSISGSSAVTVSSPGILDVNLLTGTTFGNAVSSTGAVRGINVAGTTETFSGVISGTGSFSQISGTGIFTNVNSYGGGTNITGAATVLQIGTAGLAAAAGSATINVGGGSTLQLVNVNGNVLSNNVTNAAGGGAGTVLSTSALTTTLSGTLTDGAGTLALTQNGSGTTILANFNNTYTGLTTVSAGTLQLGTNALAGSLGGGATIKVGTGGTLSLVNIGNPGTLSNALITNTLGGVGTVNILSNNNNTVSSQLTDGGPGTLQLTQTGLGTTTLLGANTYTGTTLISAGILQVGNGGAAGLLGTGAVTDNASLIFNRSDTITVANAISGSGSVTQQGGGTTILTGANTYGATAINAGTLQIGAGGVAGSLGTGIVTDNAALVFNRSDAITVANAINGSGTLTQQGTGNTNLTGVSTYSGATTVANGTLRVNGSLGFTAVTVNSGATLGGNGTIAGSVSILSGGNLAPGNSPGTITVGSLTLVTGSNSNFELGQPGVIGQASLPGNDLVNVNTNLVLAGNINVTQLAGFGAGSYRLFNYGGALTNNGTIVNGVPGPAVSAQIITGVPNQVNLLVLNANFVGLLQNWDGGGVANDGIIAGGNGTWDGFQNNWTNNAGTVNAAWQNGVANFGGATGTVTLVSPIFAQGLVFSTTGYNINGTGINVLNLVGPTPAPTVTVSGGLLATINAQILGSAGLTANGAGTLVLTNAGNSYTGGTTVTGGGAVSVSSDGNLGNAAGAITLNTGTLQTTATFASSRGITLTGTGTFDVTNANVFTASGVIGGTGALTKINTGTLVLGNAANTYNGPTNIVNGTVQVSANGNLGAVTGGLTFGGAAGNNAILQTTAGITFGNRAVTLNTAGGTIDTNGFNSSLSGVISGIAGNPLTKVGAGTLTLTGASTYLGQTNVNGGTLQVGDGVVVGTMIGNNTATVVLNNGAPLAINLANSGTFGNPVTANAGSTVIGNNTVGNTQTVTGIISGAGAVTQSGAGTTVLTAANSYNGATLVSAGTLQIGNGLAVGASITNSVSVTVNVGATLAIQLANNEAFSNNVADNGTVNLLSANTQTISGIIGGAGVLNQSGAGTAILTGNNTYAGITTISAGTLQIGSGGVSGSLGAGNVTDNSNLVFNRSDSIVIGNLISGTGTLRQQGNGVTTLIATNTYTGATTVANGTLQIGNGSTVGSSIATSTPAVAVNAGATLAINLANGETFSNGVTDNGTVNGISTGTQTLSGAITGSGVLNQNGTGTMILTGTNTYAGVTTINAGRLQIGNGGATGTLGGGAVTDNGALIFNRNNPMTVGNLISGNGTVSQQGVGGTTILTAANSYSGATTVTQGTLQIGDGVTPLASITNSVSTTVNLGAALAINLVNGETFTNNVTDNGAVNGINTGANVQTLSGSITGSGTLNQTGTGTTILTGTNSYQGITNIAAGTIQVGNGGTIGTLGSGNVTDNGALIFNRSNLMTVANVISGGGTVRQQGTGTTILTATNTYGGATTVAFGTLQIGDGATPLASIASSAVTVNSGATLAINLAPNETFVNSVTDNGAVNGISANTQTLSGVISGGGTLNQNGAGTMILTGANTYAGVTTITAGTLQVGAGAGGGATGQLGAGNVVDNGALVFNRSNAITVANAISGSGTLTQQGNGTTTLTGVGTYGGVTNVTAGTLQIGDGTSGNITSPQINVSGGAALAVRLANNATLVGNIANTGTINTISANTQTLSGNISGTGVFNQTGAGITVLTGASNYTGATTVVNGNLRVNGSLGNTALTVQTGATLSGTGSIAGTVTILSGGNLNPGTSPGTITTGTLVLNAGSNLNFELGTAGVIGQQALPGNDLVNVNGNLTLDGNLNVTPNPAITSGSYRLFNYTGTLTNNTIDSITGVNAAFTPLIVTAAAGQVNLLVLANGTGPVQFWDGVGPANNGVANGGSGNWDNFTMNWTGVAGANPNASWQNGTAVFNAPAGTVTITDTTNAQGLIFGTSGYVINSSGGNTLNLVGQNPAVNNVPFISVTNASDVATINAVVSNFYSPAPIPFGLNGGLTSTGAGKLVLTNVGNTYTGGTTITGGGTVSISDDHNLGAIPGAPGINDITLNNGALQATATFTLNSNRSIILAGAGGIDVTGTDRLTYGGVISGAGSLAKTGTGILTISGVNTYQGGTLILGGTLEISNNNNLGNVAGAVTFGNGATLKTLAGITSARAISLGAVANTGGGVIDTNGFNSTLTGIITGAAGNGLVKNGAGILTVTGASTYLGTTTINTGTLQVGDNATAGAQIGNNAANVIVGSGAILDVRLTDGGTFNNTIATALGATINSTNSAGATQTFGGIISGAGIFNQNGLGTAVLNGANTYTGQTNVNFGTVVLGNATALGTIAAGTVVASGATLDLNGQTVGAEALTIGGAGVGGNGALINGSIAVAASLSGPVSLTADTTITTFSANANATPGGSILLSGNVSGGFGIIKNGNGTLTLTGLNIYTGQTLINAGILQAGNNFALGSVGANTVVASGASLQILNGVAVVGEPVVINGFGAGVAAPGALTQSLNGSSSLAGAITVATNANISTNGTGIMTLTGGITKNGTTLTLNGGGTININGVGISGVTSFTSDLVVDGTGVGGLTVVNMNAANSYAGPTWITNGGTLNANVLAALPSTAADGLGGTASIRTTVIMDPVAAIPGTPPSPSPSSGGSILNLGASQAIQSLTGAVSSRVNLGTKTLTIGTTLGGATTFAGVISGANAAGASIIKDGTSTQIFSGPNNYTGSTTVKGGTLQAGVATVTPAGPVGTVPTSGAFGVDSVMTVNAGGTLELAGFSNTIGSLVSTPLPGGGTVQNTTVGNNAPATLTIDGINAAGTAGAVNFGGVIKDTAATALSIVKNGAGTQIFSGANTYIGTTTVDGGILQAGVATVTPAGPAGTVPTSGAFGVDSATTVNAGSVLELAGFSNTIGSLSGGGAGSFVQNTLNNAATLTIDGINAAGPAGAVTYGGVIKDTTGTALSIVKNGAGTQIFSGLNSYVGMTTVNGGILQSGVNTNAGNTGGAFGVNSATTVGTSATAATLALNGFSNTIGTLSGNTSGIIQNGSAANASVLTFGSGAVSGTTTFSGVIQNGGAATLSLIKVGTGIQVLAGTAANTYTGLTTVNAGELHLNKTAGVNAIGGNLTIGDGLGGANSDIVKLLANDQILATSLVLIDRNSGRLDLNGKTQTVGSIDDTGTVILGGSSINLGSGTLTTGAGGGANPANPNTAFSGVISGTNGNLTKTGTGIFTLNGTNTYTGATNVNAGTLRAGSTQAFGSDSAVTIAAAGTLDLAGKSNSIGSLTGPAGGFVRSSTGSATLTTGDLNADSAFLGVLQDNVGPLSLVKTGNGRQTLGGTNTYTGTTTVNGGTLLAASASAFGSNSATTVNAGGTLDLGGNSNTIGSLSGVAGGTVRNSTGNPATLTTGGLNTNTTFSGTIQNGAGAPLAFLKNGTGTQILSGTNSYTGGTTLNAGTLAAGSTKAFGSGNLTLLGGTLRTSGGPLIVDIGSGNVLFGGGTYVANVGGVIPGAQHDQLTTTGAANIGGGTLALVQQNAFQLAPGAQVNLLVASSGVAGGSALGTPVPAANVTGLSAFSSTPLLVPVVNLYLTTVTLEAMQGSFAGLGGVFGPNGQFIGFTPNQIATARALDSVSKTINFKTGILAELNYLDTQPLGTLPSNLDKIAPEEFAAFFQNSVALANVQTANLGRRMDDIRNQASAPSASGLAAAGSGPSYSGGLSGPSGKRSKEVAAPNDERWGAFLTGSGEFTHVGSTTNAAGYRFETAGVTGGLDYRVNDHFAIGMNFGYVGTTSTLVNGGKIETDGGRLGLYATYFDKNFHVDAAVTGGLNSYETRRTTPNNTSAIASPEGSEINVLIAAGYDWKVGKFTVGPTASYQYTNVHTDGFTETGAFAPLSVNGQSTESSRTSLGIRAYYDAQVAGIVIRPELRISWQHEFGDAAPTVTSRFSTLGGNPFTVTGPQIGRDSVLLGAGFTVLWSERLATYLYYDGEVGRSNYDSHNISGGIRLQF